MNTDVTTRSVHPSAPTLIVERHPVTFARVVHAEWIKFCTLRSSWLTLAGAVIAPIVIGAAIGYNTGKNFAGLAPQDSAPSGALQGSFLSLLLIGVLGVLLVSSEYSTGMIRSTLAAVPLRLPVLVAKALVFGTVSLLTMVLTSFVTFITAQLFLTHYDHGTALTAPGVLRVIIGTGAYLALIGILGTALGWIMRSTPGGISAFVVAVLVVPVLLAALPGQLAQELVQYLPSEAGRSFASSVHTEHTLTPWAGLGVLVLWVAAALGTAAFLLRRRDG